jgi:hypothetical protein
MKLARELQKQVGRSVAWGMRVGESTTLFTTRSTPVMTRLGRVERNVLDTLVAAGVADTRSAALAYAVRVFAAEHGDWLAEARGSRSLAAAACRPCRLSRRKRKGRGDRRPETRGRRQEILPSAFSGYGLGVKG